MSPRSVPEQAETSPSDTTAAPRSRVLVFGLVMLTAVTGVVGSLGAPMVPEIAKSTGVTLSTAQWALTVSLLVGAVVTPIVGRLGSGPHRRRTVLACLALVVVGSGLAALGPGFASVVVGRGLQGVGFAIAPLALSIARDVSPPDRTTRDLATLSVASVLGAGLGFPVSAFTTALVGVRGAFGVAFAITAFTFVVAAWTVPRSRATTAVHVDLPGAGLLGIGTACALLAIAHADDWGYTSGATLGLLVAGVIVLAMAVAWMWTRRFPLVDLRLAIRPGVLAPNVVALLAGTGMYVLLASVMVLVQSGHDGGYGLGRSVAVAGVLMLPYALASWLGSRVSLRLVPWVGADRLLPLGCVVFGLGNGLLAVLHSELWEIVLVMVVAGLGSGATFNSIPWIMARVVPNAETSAALGFNVVLRFLGFSTGSALSVAVLRVAAGDDGAPTQTGFVAVALVGVVLCLIAATACLLLPRSSAPDDAVS